MSLPRVGVKPCDVLRVGRLVAGSRTPWPSRPFGPVAGPKSSIHLNWVSRGVDSQPQDPIHLAEREARVLAGMADLPGFAELARNWPNDLSMWL